MNNYGRKWKQLVKAGELVVGGHIFMPGPHIAEALVYHGYKYIWIDGEHGAFDKEQILMHIMAVNGAGGGAFVRVTSRDSNVIKPILEMGPDGIIIPMICDVRQAAEAVAACTYPPKGIRGFGPRRAARYGAVSDPDYLEEVLKDDNLVKLIQIEHIDGVNNLDEILKIDGIDGVIIGPCDLSGSLGFLTKIKDPKVLTQIEKIIEKCRVHNIPCGPSIGPADREYVKFWLDRKVNFIFCGDELSFVKMGAEATLGMFSSLTG
jgi:2-keto-3-deoxy-L-rhamnonate aldolase RhmA